MKHLNAILGEEGQRAFHDIAACVHPLIGVARSRNSLHAQIVLNGCVVGLNVLNVIADVRFPVVALGLCRTLHEIFAGVAHLASNPDEVADFELYGQWLSWEIARSDDVHLPRPGEGADLFKHFKKKADEKRMRVAFPTWHGMNQHSLLTKYLDSGVDDFKNKASAYLHGDSLIAIAAVTYDPQQGWYSRPFVWNTDLNFRLALDIAAALCSDMLVGAEQTLELKRPDVVMRLHKAMLSLGALGYPELVSEV